MNWQYSEIQVSCVNIHCLWRHPVALIWFARIYRSQLSTTNQSQGECPRSVNHSCAYTADKPPGTACTGQCPSPTQAQCCPYLVRYLHAQTANNGGEQSTTTELKNAPPLTLSKRRNKNTYNIKQCKKKELDQAREITRIHIGASFQSWRELQDSERLKSVSELAAFLLGK